MEKSDPHTPLDRPAVSISLLLRAAVYMWYVRISLQGVGVTCQGEGQVLVQLLLFLITNITIITLTTSVAMIVTIIVTIIVALESHHIARMTHV